MPPQSPPDPTKRRVVPFLVAQDSLIAFREIKGAGKVKIIKKASRKV